MGHNGTDCGTVYRGRRQSCVECNPRHHNIDCTGPHALGHGCPMPVREKPATFTATYKGPGEFYSGIRRSERVLVQPGNGDAPGYSIQSIEFPGVWLHIYAINGNLLTERSN